MYSLFIEVHVPCQYQSCDIFFHLDKVLIFVAVKILLQCRKGTIKFSVENFLLYFSQRRFMSYDIFVIET